MEVAELESDDPNTQQLLATLALADHGLDNGGERADLDRALDALLVQLGSERNE